MIDTPDLETRAAPEDHHALRLWLRMLTCCNLIESEIRSRLRTEFDTTLPRFDLMAQLQRAPKGMKMGELSRHMMVTNGNITGITDQLEKEGLVVRTKVESDRRSSVLKLTPQGKRTFARMARARKLGHRHARRPARGQPPRHVQGAGRAEAAGGGPSRAGPARRRLVTGRPRRRRPGA